MTYLLLSAHETFFSIFSIIVPMFAAIIFLLVFATIGVNIYRMIKMHKMVDYFAQSVIRTSFDKTQKYQDISKEKLEQFHIEDIGSLKDSLFELFEEFEKAYNDLDYNAMKQISTAQLYENYYTGIKLNNKDGKRKVIKDIHRNKVVVFDINSSDVRQTIKSLIEISYITYTEDKSGNVVSGNKNNKITESFEVTFQKEYDKNNFQRCPNCGATVSGKYCEYCRTNIKDTEFKISSIRKVVIE